MTRDDNLTDRLLHHEPVTAAGAEPGSWLYVLPGIYGAGRNWATVARRVVAARPDWGAVLVDLREHGASQGFPPPHTIAAAAADVARLAEATVRAVTAVLGHSFGGKVALELVRRAPAGLRQAWIIDSTPDAREPAGSAWEMLQRVEAMPEEFESRDQVIAELVRRGTDQATAQWMATNLERSDGRFRWRFSLPAMKALLLDFFRTDAWDVVMAPPDGVELIFVRASRSSVLSAQAAARLEAAGPRVRLLTVEGGHWLNADNPDAMVDLLTRLLVTSE